MQLEAARQVIDALVQGIHPVTGAPMPPDSPYHVPIVITALQAASQALDAGVPTSRTKPRRDPPANAGKAWRPEEDARLQDAFETGADMKQLALGLGRTPFAVESRLVRLGKLPPRPGMRLTAPAS